MDASVEVGLLWEGAADPPDDDVGGVVSCSDALLQWLFLDQRWEESWVGSRGEVSQQGKCLARNRVEKGQGRGG